MWPPYSQAVHLAVHTRTRQQTGPNLTAWPQQARHGSKDKRECQVKHEERKAPWGGKWQALVQSMHKIICKHKMHTVKPREESKNPTTNKGSMHIPFSYPDRAAKA